jgi:hypothetical protein
MDEKLTMLLEALAEKMGTSVEDMLKSVIGYGRPVDYVITDILKQFDVTPKPQAPNNNC